MKIDQIIELWNKSKYNRLMIKTLPCINNEKEITWGTGIYTKGQKILCGGEYNIEDYLKEIYKNSIFMLEFYEEEMIAFKIIIKGEDNNVKNIFN